MTARSLYLNHHQSNRAPLGCCQDNQDRRQKSVLWVIMVRLKPKFTQKWVQVKMFFLMCLLSYFCCFLLKMLFILSFLNPQVTRLLTPTWCYDEKLKKKIKKKQRHRTFHNHILTLCQSSIIGPELSRSLLSTKCLITFYKQHLETFFLHLIHTGVESVCVIEDIEYFVK